MDFSPPFIFVQLFVSEARLSIDYYFFLDIVPKPFLVFFFFFFQFFFLNNYKSQTILLVSNFSNYLGK